MVKMKLHESHYLDQNFLSVTTQLIIQLRYYGRNNTVIIYSPCIIVNCARNRYVVVVNVVSQESTLCELHDGNKLSNPCFGLLNCWGECIVRRISVSSCDFCILRLKFTRVDNFKFKKHILKHLRGISNL